MFRLDLNTGNSSAVRGQAQQPNIQLRRRGEVLQPMREPLELLREASESSTNTREGRIKAREMVRTSYSDVTDTSEITKELFQLTTSSLLDIENQEKVVSKILDILPDFFTKITQSTRENPPNPQDKPLIEFAHTILQNPEIFEQAYKLTGDSDRGERARRQLNKLWEMTYIVDGLPRKQLSPQEQTYRSYHDALDKSGDKKVLYINNSAVKINDPEDVEEFVADYELVKRMRDNLKKGDALPARFAKWLSDKTGLLADYDGAGKYKIHDMVEAHYIQDIKHNVSEAVA